jgi:hypothetical protein
MELIISEEEKKFLTDLVQMERSRFNGTSVKDQFPEYEQMTSNLLLKLGWDTSQRLDW